MDGCENPPCCLLQCGDAGTFLQKNWGRISPDKELCDPRASIQAGLSLFPCHFTHLPLHCFLILPGNLQLELSHGDGNQTRRGIRAAAGKTRQYLGYQRLSITQNVLRADLVSERTLSTVQSCCIRRLKGKLFWFRFS